MYLREAVLESFIKMKFEMDGGEDFKTTKSLSTIQGEVYELVIKRGSFA